MLSRLLDACASAVALGQNSNKDWHLENLFEISCEALIVKTQSSVLNSHVYFRDFR